MTGRERHPTGGVAFRNIWRTLRIDELVGFTEEARKLTLARRLASLCTGRPCAKYHAKLYAKLGGK